MADVIPIRPTGPEQPSPGYLGLVWSISTDTRTRRTYLRGTPPEGGRWTVSFKLEYCPRNVDLAALEAGARIWSDIPEGAAALMAAAETNEESAP